LFFIVLLSQPTETEVDNVVLYVCCR